MAPERHAPFPAGRSPTAFGVSSLLRWGEIMRIRRVSEPRTGEFFAPLPLAFVALMVVNDVWLKPAFHSELTGKLSDIAVCFFMPLFLSELLGLSFGWRPTVRLWTGAAVTAVLYVGLEIVPPFTRLAIGLLDRIGPYLGIRRHFHMTEDWTDLLCVLLVPVAVAYGERRLKRLAARPDASTPRASVASR